MKQALWGFLMMAALGSPRSAVAAIGVNIDPAAAPGYAINSEFVGVGYDISYASGRLLTGNEQRNIALLRTLGVRTIRLGAEAVDHVEYVGGVRAPGMTNQVLTDDDIDAFFAFAGLVQAKVIFGLNLGSYSPATARKEAEYVMRKYASQLVGFEIGNEPDLYYKNGLRTPAYGYADFKKEFTAYRDSIRRVLPSARFVGPSATKSADWAGDFARDFPNTTPADNGVSLITYHHYVTAADTEDASPAMDSVKMKLLLGPEAVASDLSIFKSIKGAADSARIPFAMDETNSMYHGGRRRVSNAMVAALWALDYMYFLASHGCASLNFHSPFGGRYSPIMKADGDYKVGAEYYGILAFNQGSKGSLLPLSITNPEGINATVYGVRETGSLLRVTLINKEARPLDADFSLTFADPGFRYASVARLSASSLLDTSNVRFAGASVDGAGGWSPLMLDSMRTTSGSLTITVPHAGAAVVTLSKIPLSTSLRSGPSFPAPNATVRYDMAHGEVFVSGSGSVGRSRVLNGRRFTHSPGMARK